LLFHKIISIENLFRAWHEFKRGKSSNYDVQVFAFALEDNLFALHEELVSQTWTPGAYTGFYIKDPKLRRIHKATVRDRVLHQAIFRVLDPLFDPYFIAHSFSSRTRKGTHRGVDALESFGRKATKNWKRKAYVLSLDIRKFFDSVDHGILVRLIERRITEVRLRKLLLTIIESFNTESGKGIPLGNVTSQLFANVYLNELDQYVKRTLHARYYARYCDDFLMVSLDRKHLAGLIPSISAFLKRELRLELHPLKIEIRPFEHGIDFLGYVVRPHHRVFRTRTKRRLLKNIRKTVEAVKNGTVEQETLLAMADSYRGMLGHCRAQSIQEKMNKLLSMCVVDSFTECGIICPT